MKHNHNWEYRHLGDVATYINGYAFKPSDWRDNGYPIIRIQNLNNKEADYNYSDGEIPSRYFVNNGDLLISWSASLGAYIWQGEKAVLNQHIFKVVLDKTSIVKNYLKYFVDFSLPLMASKTHGATMKHITKPLFAAIQIPFPEKDVQEQIVAELDKINEVIADCKKLLTNLDALAQSLFYSTFGDPITNPHSWPECKLGDVCTVTSSSRIFANEYCENGIPFYRGKEISELSRGERLSIELFISPNRYESFKNSDDIPHIGDILITAVGTIGNIWVVDTMSPFYFKDGNIIWLKDINFNVSNSNFFRFQLYRLIEIEKGKMANGSAYKALTIQNLKKLSILLPPLSLQEEFAKRIEAIEEQKKAVEQTIATLQTLLAARMDYWFN